MKTTTQSPQKRLIIDYKNVTPNILQMFSDKFPYGYDEGDLIQFRNAKGQTVKSIPIETPDAKYLIKISVEMEKKIEAFADDEPLEDDETFMDEGAPEDEVGEED